MKQLKGEINLQLKKLQGTHSYKIENIGFSWSHFIIKCFFHTLVNKLGILTINL